MNLETEARIARLETMLGLFEPEEIKSRLSIRNIQQLVAAYYGIARGDITGQSRKAGIVYARHMATALVKDLRPDMSYAQIGRAFGGRDHTTIIHGVKKITQDRSSRRVKAEYTALKRSCEGIAK